MAPYLNPARRTIGRAARLASAVVLVTVALAMTTAGASGAGGRLQLYLVNSGPATTFYPQSAPSLAECEDFYTKPAMLSTTKGTTLQTDSPGYAFTSDPLDAIPSRFAYAVPAGGGFTVPVSPDALVLKLWASSGDGSCLGQDGDQTIDWRVLCSGTCGSEVSLSGTGQNDPDKLGWQAFDVPAGTPINTLFNVHAGPSTAISVGVGDVITLEVSSDSWTVVQWSAPKGAGVSNLMILTK
jgi:hypothetical protein